MGVTRLIRDVTIGSGTALSDEIDLGGYRLAGVHMPAAWTAASITFQAAPDPGGTFGDVVDQGGTEIALTVGAGEVVLCVDDTTENLEGIQIAKVRSGTSASPVNQAAARVLRLILK